MAQHRRGSAQGTHHAGVHRRLLDVPGYAGHKGVSVFKVCVKISLWVKQGLGLKYIHAGCSLT